MSEKAALIVTWDGAVFRPRTRYDTALAAKFRRDLPLQADIKERRSEPRNRLYWAILQSVVDATGRWPTAEALHWALKIRLGYIQEINAIEGGVLILPRSTAFGKMPEQEFRGYFEAVMELLTGEVTGLTVEELLLLGKARLAPQNGRAA